MKIKCPRCKSDLEVDAIGDFVSCSSCSVEFHVEESQKTKSLIENFHPFEESKPYISPVQDNQTIYKPSVKHKFSLFLLINGWIFIILGALLIVLTLGKPTSQQSFVGLYGIFIGTVYFIIDYVIQILFEGVNHLEELNSKIFDLKTGSENKSVETTKSEYTNLEPLPIYTKLEAKKIAVEAKNNSKSSMKVSDKKDWIGPAIIIIILLFLSLIASGLLK